MNNDAASIPPFPGFVAHTQFSFEDTVLPNEIDCVHIPNQVTMMMYSDILVILAIFLVIVQGQPTRTLLLPVDMTMFKSMSNDLEIDLVRPVRAGYAVTPTEAWESWAVFAYNSVVRMTDSNGLEEHRMYYDCIEGTGVPPGENRGDVIDISHRRICLATSTDGLRWDKPELGIFERNGSKANNILLEDSGVSVFFDPNASSDARWKMVCSNSAYASPDGLRWSALLPFRPVATDDTKPVAYYDPSTKQYTIVVRRDLAPPAGKSGDVVRYIGRCDTDDLTDWEKNYNETGCPPIFGVDEKDPDHVDIYTSAWTPYPSIDDPNVVHLYFPSMYAHFDSSAPFGFSNDGLLDIRLLTSRDGYNLSYVPASRNKGRSSYVSLGVNRCGSNASTPSVKGGWCSPFTGIENSTSPDTSGMYMASGYVNSLDDTEVYLYASAQPFTHGGDAGKQLWSTNTAIQILRTRKHGFASIEAPYDFSSSEMPSFTTTDVKIPECARDVVVRVNVETSVVGYVQVGIVGSDDFAMTDGDPIQGNTVDAIASWNGGRSSSLSSIQGQTVSLEVGMRDAKLYSIEVGCVDA